MPRGVYKRKAQQVPNEINSLAGQQSGNVDLSKVTKIQTADLHYPEQPKPVEPVKMFPVKLLYNYKPAGAFEAIGWEKPAVEKKNAAGQMITVEAAAFIKGEISPAPYPGVGFAGKVWKGSVIGLPREEAMTLVNSKRAERADAFPS